MLSSARLCRAPSDYGHCSPAFIEAPILAYLIETPNGRILYDVGCDYRKIATPELRSRYFDPMRPLFEPPQMSEQQRIPLYLKRLGLEVKDIDLIFLGHLHFDHAGGLCDLPGCEVHVHREELAAARTQLDQGIFDDEIETAEQWRLQTGEYQLSSGVRALTTPGHTAGQARSYTYFHQPDYIKPLGRPPE